MAEDKRNSTQESSVPKASGGHDELSEIAGILARAFLRLRAKHVAGPKKREISRDNRLEVSCETSPDAVNL